MLVVVVVWLFRFLVLILVLFSFVNISPVIGSEGWIFYTNFVILWVGMGSIRGGRVAVH